MTNKYDLLLIQPEVTVYADNSTSGASWEEVKPLQNNNFELTLPWLYINKLLFNVSKSIYKF